MVMNTVTDFYLMAIPLPASSIPDPNPSWLPLTRPCLQVIWGSQLPTRKKVVLILMFSGAFLEMTFGILRCVSILTVGDTDPAQSGYWSVRESFVSMVVTNMPMVYPLFRSLVEKGRNMSSRNKTYPSGDESRGYRLDSISRQQRQKGGSHPHPLSMPNDTIWESNSKEKIVGNTDRPAGSQSTSNSGDEVSLGLPMHGPRATAVRGGSSGSSSRRPDSDPHHIVVTSEYTVAEAGPVAEPIGVARF
ncbi:hypothetical protein SLS62_007929 [Diatrype stigma]|uniref:Rhodopsin domain-containing protein n=1 Tax=Diatrype stigma TaxID=117547 RepID=A0AAN9UMH7_9PEZI